jgi:hypothetical protein
VEMRIGVAGSIGPSVKNDSSKRAPKLALSPTNAATKPSTPEIPIGPPSAGPSAATVAQSGASSVQLDSGRGHSGGSETANGLGDRGEGNRGHGAVKRTV